MFNPVLQNPSFVPIEDVVKANELYGVDDDNLASDNDEQTVILPDEDNPLTEEETVIRDRLYVEQQDSLTSWIDVYKWYRHCTMSLIQQR
jgi:hypothetical protein